MWTLKISYEISCRKLPRSIFFRYTGYKKEYIGCCRVSNERIFEITYAPTEAKLISEWLRSNFEIVREIPDCFDKKSTEKIKLGYPLSGYLRTQKADVAIDDAYDLVLKNVETMQKQIWRIEKDSES